MRAVVPVMQSRKPLRVRGVGSMQKICVQCKGITTADLCPFCNNPSDLDRVGIGRLVTESQLIRLMRISAKAKRLNRVFEYANILEELRDYVKKTGDQGEDYVGDHVDSSDNEL